MRDHSHRPGRGVRLRPRRDRDHAQRFRVPRDFAHGHGLQIRRRNSHHHPGLPAHAHHIASAGKAGNLKLKLIQIPIPPKNLNEIAAAFEKGITERTRLILISHMINITGQITPVKAVCDLARARGIETIVDGAHSFAQFYFKQKALGCDYFGTSLHKWLFAPKGTGMLYVKRDKVEKLWPLMAAEAKQASDIRKFEEIGTHSAAPKLAIGEALLFHNGIGGKRKEARLRYLSRYWMNRLKDVPKIRFNTSFDPSQMCAITK